MNGPPTRDLNPIYNAPMLGAHKLFERDFGTRAERRFLSGSRVAFGKEEIIWIT